MRATVEDLRTEIEIVREVAFSEEQQPKDYIVSRGVEPSATDRPPWTTYGYRQALPKLLGLDVMEFIQGVVDRRGMARVLDVGCGSGRFLDQCKRGYRRYADGLTVPGWNEKVECYGLTACLYNSAELDSVPAGIHMKLGDAQNLARLYYGQSFDVITAVHVAHHVADPWALFFGMYEKLADGGGCFVRGIPFSLVDGEDANLADYLRARYSATVNEPYFDRRYQERCADISMVRRRGVPLVLPLNYAGINDRPLIPRVLYRFDPTVAFQPAFA
ncbi:methyltransferase domain-containing protein [Candidatus Daviesbacteria bacterium]|nr:methyltransferase domain-containing protein [Candidatus Daviesbacteria bacterium]